MALIVRDELMHECVSAGRVVEHIVLEKLKHTDTSGLDDRELEEAFEPVVKYVEQRTEVRVRAEVDELEAIIKEKKMEDKLDDKRAEIRSNIDGQVVFKINGKRKDRVSFQVPKRLKRAIDEKLLPEFSSARLEERPPEASLSELDYETDLDYYTWHKHWDQFCPTVEVIIDTPGDIVAANKGLGNFGEYLLSEKLSRDYTIADIIDVLVKNKHTFAMSPPEYMEAKKLLKTLDSMMTPGQLTLESTFKFIHDLDNANCAVSDMMFRIVQYFHEKKKQMLCGAYDCFDEILHDNALKTPGTCEEEDCNVKICAECWGMGRKKCEDHRPNGG